jgi:hypothetical protein
MSGVTGAQEVSKPARRVRKPQGGVRRAGGTVDPVWKFDGVNLLPYVTGENKERPPPTLLCRMNGRWAIRHGDMKLVVGDDSVRAPELFDLAAKQPDTVKELKALWDQWNTQLAPPRRDGANSNFSPGDGGDSELEQIQPAARPSRS